MIMNIHNKISIYLFGMIFLLLNISCKSNIEELSAEIPRIISISEDITTVINSLEKITISAEVSDSGTINYQWFVAEDKLSVGTIIDGANQNELFINSDNAGVKYYYCIITNSFGESVKTSVSPRIKVSISERINALPPEIINYPQNFSSIIGDIFSFSVSAYSVDKGKITYQWYYKQNFEADSILLVNETAPTFEGTITLDKIGIYYCEITNTINDNGDGGLKSSSIITNNVCLTNDIVNANQPVILNNLSNDSVIIPAIKIIEVTAWSIDDGALSYQWYTIAENQDQCSIIENATSNKLRLDVTELGKHGYFCEVTNTIDDNGDGGTKSNCIITETVWIDGIYLKNIVSAPTIVSSPSNILIVPYNTSAELSCVAESYIGDVSYRWYESLDGTITNGTPIPNAYSSTLKTPKYTQKGSHYYYCVVANSISTDDLDTKTAVAFSNISEVAYNGLPLIQINTVNGEEPTCDYVSMEGKGGKTIKNATKVPSRMRIFEAENASPIYDSGEFIEDKSGCTIKIRGNTSAYGAKKPYKIKLQKKADLLDHFIQRNEKKYRDKNWVLLKDATNLKTAVGFEVSRKLESEWTPQYIFANLVINNDYRGVYMLVESIKDSEGRINISDTGYIIENDVYYWNEDKYFITDKYSLAITFKYPDPDEITSEQFEYIKEYMNLTDDSVMNNTYDDYIDYESFAKWFLIHDILGTYDMAGANMYMSKYDNTLESKIKMSTPWDFNSIYGSYNVELDENQIEEFARLHNGFRVYAKYLFSSENSLFLEAYKNQWNHYKTELYSKIIENLVDINSSLGEEINSSRYCDAKRWNLSNYNTVLYDVNIASEWFSRHLSWLDTTIKELGSEQ